MTTFKQIDVCPICAIKVQEEISKLQENFARSKEAEMKKHSEGDQKETKRSEGGNHPEGEGSHFGQVLASTPEEVNRCLSSLGYTVPICESCKHSKDISIIQLAPNAFSTQKPQDQERK